MGGGGLDDTMVVTHSAQIVVAWTRRDRDPFTDEKKSNALLIAAAPDLADVAHMVLTTATVYTPQELVKAATEALRKAGEM